MSLFKALQLGPYKIKNRIVMAPLARARSDEARAPTELVEIYYAQRASAGLIISEASHVSPFSVSRPNTSAHHSEAQNRAWARVVAAVHAAGGLIFQQLYHVGRKAHSSRLPGGASPLAPSAIPALGETPTAAGLQPFSTPRALRLAEIPGVVEEFRAAARNALSAGFDGVELHAANGFLIDQFLRDGSNDRTDAYGGSIANRSRFLLDIVDAVSDVFGPQRIGVRLSPHFRSDGIRDSDPAALFGHVAAALNAREIAYLHVIEGLRKGDDHGPLDGGEFLAPLLRKAFRGPLILAGGYSQETAQNILAARGADAIAFGRLFISNPDLPGRFRVNAPLAEPDVATFYSGGPKGYIDYPALEAVAAG